MYVQKNDSVSAQTQNERGGEVEAPQTPSDYKTEHLD